MLAIIKEEISKHFLPENIKNCSFFRSLSSWPLVYVWTCANALGMHRCVHTVTCVSMQLCMWVCAEVHGAPRLMGMVCVCEWHKRWGCGHVYKCVRPMWVHVCLRVSSMMCTHRRVCTCLY
jgi:hypothetical protein